MAIAKKKKKLLSVLVVGGLAAFLFNYGRPEVRFRRDAKNPKSGWGGEVAAWLGSHSDATIDTVLSYHTDPVNKSVPFAQYMAKGWALTQ